MDQLQESGLHWYGVCELDHHLREAIRLTNELKKSLATVKFLTGSHFVLADGYGLQMNEMRSELQRFHAFICEQRERTCQTNWNANEAEEDASDEMDRRTEGSRFTISEVHDLLSQHPGLELQYSETSVKHQQLQVRNARRVPNAGARCRVQAVQEAPLVHLPHRQSLQQPQQNSCRNQQLAIQSVQKPTAAYSKLKYHAEDVQAEYGAFVNLQDQQQETADEYETLDAFSRNQAELVRLPTGAIQNVKLQQLETENVCEVLSVNVKYQAQVVRLSSMSNQQYLL